LLAHLHAPDLAYHFHGDHLVALLLKYSAGQLNTLVNFESALWGLGGQFSVGVNRVVWMLVDSGARKIELLERTLFSIPEKMAFCVVRTSRA